MSTERDNYRQLDLLDVPPGTGEISKSAWTEFADEHGVRLRISNPAIHRNPGIRLRGRTLFDNRRGIFFAGNIWDEYLKGNKGNTDSILKINIQKYKKSHHQARPEWAKTFSERDGYNRENTKILEWSQSENGRFCSLEQELFNFTLGQITIYRFVEFGGRCGRVVVICPESEDSVYIRQEDWVSKSKWSVSLDTHLSKKEINKLPYFNLVAQSY